MSKLEKLIKEKKAIVAEYKEDGGLLDNIAYYQENHNYFRNDFDEDLELEEITNDYIEEKLCERHDEYLSLEHYVDFEHQLTDALKDLGGLSSEWNIDATNINWRGQSGTLNTSDPDKVIQAILMHDGRCNTTVWEGEDDNTLDGVCYHHDCPTGTWFTITGVKE